MTRAEHDSILLRAAAGDRGALPERRDCDETHCPVPCWLHPSPGAVPKGIHDGTTEPMELDDETWSRRRRSAEEAARELEEMHRRPPFRMDEHFEEFDPDQEEETAHE